MYFSLWVMGYVFSLWVMGRKERKEKGKPLSESVGVVSLISQVRTQAHRVLVSNLCARGMCEFRTKAW